MQEVRGERKNDSMVVYLAGHIDSTNAPEVEKEVFRLVEEAAGAPVVIDAQELEYISSAGLRVILRLRKTHPELSIRGVSSEVFEILEMTGFTQMMTVERPIAWSAWRDAKSSVGAPTAPSIASTRTMW